MPGKKETDQGNQLWVPTTFHLLVIDVRIILLLQRILAWESPCLICGSYAPNMANLAVVLIVLLKKPGRPKHAVILDSS